MPIFGFCASVIGSIVGECVAMAATPWWLPWKEMGIKRVEGCLTGVWLPPERPGRWLPWKQESVAAALECVTGGCIGTGTTMKVVNVKEEGMERAQSVSGEWLSRESPGG